MRKYQLHSTPRIPSRTIRSRPRPASRSPTDTQALQAPVRQTTSPKPNTPPCPALVRRPPPRHVAHSRTTRCYLQPELCFEAVRDQGTSKRNVSNTIARSPCCLARQTQRIGIRAASWSLHYVWRVFRNLGGEQGR